MSRSKNLAGQRFGNIVAVEPTPRRKNKYTIWRCLCDCGRVVEVASRYLKNGWTTSCGDPDCQYTQQKMKMHPRSEDLTGQRFGKLLVRKMLPERSDSGHVLWDCICDCGKTIAVPTGQLKAGYRKSCGCLSRPPIKDWVGKTFGHLTVIAYDGKRSGRHWWKCRCDCGNEAVICQSHLQIGHTISCGCMNKPYETRTLVDGTCIEMIRNAVEKKTIAKNNSSGVRGVYKHKRTGRWCAQITFQGKTKYLGSYETLQEAAKARQRGEEIFEDFLAAYDKQVEDGKIMKHKAQTDRTQPARKPQTDQLREARKVQTDTPQPEWQAQADQLQPGRKPQADRSRTARKPQTDQSRTARPSKTKVLAFAENNEI